MTPGCVGRSSDQPGLVARLLDPGRPFDLYFCVQERGRDAWSVRHPAPSPYHLLYIPGRGRLIGTVDGMAVAVDPGDMLWIQPLSVFSLSAHPVVGGIDLGVCRFDLADDPILRLPEGFRLGRCPEGMMALDELMPGRDLGPAIDPLLRRAVLARLICRGFTEADADGARDGLAPSLRRRLEDFLARNIARRIGIHDLAAEAGMNADYLSRRFRLAFGASPKTYIMRMRIRQAASHLLAGDDAIAEVARRFGYDNAFLFARQFHQVMGRSPSAWRASGGR